MPFEADPALSMFSNARRPLRTRTAMQLDLDVEEQGACEGKMPLPSRTRTAMQLDLDVEDHPGPCKAQLTLRSRTAMLVEADPVLPKLSDQRLLMRTRSAMQPGLDAEKPAPCKARTRTAMLIEADPSHLSEQMCTAVRPDTLPMLLGQTARPRPKSDKKYAHEKQVHDTFKKAVRASSSAPLCRRTGVLSMLGKSLVLG
eukprot:TRINITY_DN382_c0_g1_i1.p1 TRINITY_DN382_c0_g1~~TRINITY_DN382_c0_g1_i1.p1  ORF type:complete len:200 (+),score=30.77 TRINITY_DN382_c0_g1_i1:79-678(+)